MSFPERVRIVEVGPRDGLQNEAQTVPAEVKVELIEKMNPEWNDLGDQEPKWW